MTTERAKLVEDNLRLVYYFYEKLMKTPFVRQNKDDLISEGNIGLVKAAASYDFERAKFTTYAARCIHNQMLMYIRRCKGWERETSLYAAVGADENGRELRYIDILPDGNDRIAEAETRVTAAQYISRLPKRDQKLLRLQEQGLTHLRIGKRLGYSQSYVSRRLSAARKKFFELTR
jgi:RNA polymerase sporulation-specific sigma factor